MSKNNEYEAIVITENGILDSNNANDINSILFSKVIKDEVSKTIINEDKNSQSQQLKNLNAKGLFNLVMKGTTYSEIVFEQFKKIIEDRYNNQVVIYRGEPFVNTSRADHPHLVKSEDYKYQKIEIEFICTDSEKVALLNDKVFNLIHSIFYNTTFDTVLHFPTIEVNSSNIWAYRNYDDSLSFEIPKYNEFNFDNLVKLDEIKSGLTFNFFLHEFTEAFYIQNRYYKNDNTFSKANDRKLLYRPSHWFSLINQAEDFKALMTINTHEPIDFGVSWNDNGWQYSTYYFQGASNKINKLTYKVRIIMDKVSIDLNEGTLGGICYTDLSGRKMSGEITKAQYLDEVKTHKELLNNYSE